MALAVNNVQFEPIENGNKNVEVLIHTVYEWHLLMDVFLNNNTLSEYLLRWPALDKILLL